MTDIRSKELKWALLFILPCLAGLGILTYLPTLTSLGLSFTYWDLLGTPTWVGGENYRQILADPLFWKVLGNTGVFVLAVSLGELVLGLAIAVLLNSVVRGKSVLRALYFLPFITPMLSVALVWGWLYDPTVGLLNGVLQKLGLLHTPVAWLYDIRTALPAVILLEIWKTLGYTVVLFLAGLQAIPTTLYESAHLEGANAWQRFWQITLPMVTPTLFFVMTITLIHAFQSFDAIYLLTQGGPENATAVLVYWLYKTAFGLYQVGPASAMAYLLFVMILALTLLQWQLRKRWVLYEDDHA